MKQLILVNERKNTRKRSCNCCDAIASHDIVFNRECSNTSTSIILCPNCLKTLAKQANTASLKAKFFLDCSVIFYRGKECIYGNIESLNENSATVISLQCPYKFIVKYEELEVHEE